MDKRDSRCLVYDIYTREMKRARGEVLREYNLAWEWVVASRSARENWHTSPAGTLRLRGEENLPADETASPSTIRSTPLLSYCLPFYRKINNRSSRFGCSVNLGYLTLALTRHFYSRAGVSIYTYFIVNILCKLLSYVFLSTIARPRKIYRLTFPPTFVFRIVWIIFTDVYRYNWGKSKLAITVS